jgi:hypothetical protein
MGQIKNSSVKIQIYSLRSLGLVLGFVFLSGCDLPRSYGTYGTFFHSGISPIQPVMGYGFTDRYQTTGTLTPELKWKDLKTTNQTYEVAIWETPYRSVEDVKKKGDQFHSSWGTLVFSTNNLATNSYQVAISLKPDTYYNWSVRIHEADKVGRWSSFEQQRAVLSVMYTHSDIPFAFKTPVQ